MVADKRKADLSDSDDDFDPSSEASPALAEKPSKKKAKPRGSRRRNLPEEEEECRCSALQREPEDRDDGTSPKKKKNVDALRYGVDLTEFDQSPELTAKYAAMSTTELGQWLKANLVVRPATKAHMVARCVDGELWGAIPPCPRCHVGRLKVHYASPDAHAGQGEWTCGGTYDKDLNMYVKCYFTAKPGEVERLPWRDLPRPRPGSARGGRRRRRRRRRRASARLRLVREAGGGRRDQGNRREARVPAPRGERQRGDRRMPPSD